MAESPAAPIAPDVGTGQVVLEVMVTCDDLWPQAPDGGRRVNFEAVPSEANVFVTGKSLHAVPEDACTAPAEEYAFEHRFNISGTTDAPGQKAVTTRFTAWLDAGIQPVQPESPRHEVDAVSSFAYYGVLQVKSHARLVAVDGTGEAAMELENFANARTKVAFEVLADGGGQVSVSDDLILESPTRGPTGTVEQVDVRFTEPAGSWREAMVKLRITPESAKDGSTGQPVVVNILFRDQGGLLGADVPGVPTPLLAVALAAVAFLARRGRP